MQLTQQSLLKRPIERIFRYAEFGKLYSIPLVVVSGLFTTLLANGNFPDMVVFVLYCSILSIGYTGALAIDDMFDYESDVANNRKEKPLVAGTVTRKQAFVFATLVFVFTGIALWLLLGPNVFLVYFGMYIYLFVFCFIGNRVKLPMITQFATVTATNLVSVILPFVAFCTPDPLMVILYVAGVVWDFCHDCPSSIKHMKGDKESGQRTAATDFGPQIAAWISLCVRPVWILMGYWIASRHMGAVAFLVMTVAVIWGTHSTIKLVKDPSIAQASRTYSQLTLEFLFITMGFVIDTLLGHPSRIWEMPIRSLFAIGFN